MHLILVLLSLFLYSINSLRYDGTRNSWAKYSKWNMCPHKHATLYFTFKTNRPDGLLVYMDDGKPSPKDYLLIQLQGGKVSLQYNFGISTSPANFTRVDREIANNTQVSISIERRRMALILAIATDPGTSPQIPNFGSDLCFGGCEDGLNYKLSSGNSDLYIGGVPPSIRSRPSPAMTHQFSGDIYDVEYKNCECRRSNPVVLALGSAVKKDVDPCFNKTEAGCTCRLDNGGNSPSCQCLNCAPVCTKAEVTQYSLDFDNQEDSYLTNNDGLDSRVYGTTNIPAFPVKYLTLGGGTYAQFAGESQRDECLGNLKFCPDGYTLSFWMVILNDDLTIRNGNLINNGGHDSHGIVIYWQNNALHTKFRRPDGRTWTNVAYELYPAMVHYEGGTFVHYRHSYAASWSVSKGLQVYINGVSVGMPSNPTYETVRNPNNRHKFLLGSQDANMNMMGIADVNFVAEYRTQAQIFGYTGSRHYFFSMNSMEGNRLVTWPSYLNAVVSGASQLVQGRADMAIQLGTSAGSQSYVDAGDCSATCFGRVKECDFYVSFWLRFDTLWNGMTILDTGKSGFSIQYRDQKLMALIYAGNNLKPIRLSFASPETDRWYFVEVDRDSSSRMNSLWIDGQKVSTSKTAPFGRPDPTYIHNGVASNLFIGKRNADAANSYPVVGKFTIDQLDMFQGRREYLRQIGHIQRGIPPHIFYNMDGYWKAGSSYLNYVQRYVRYNATAEIQQPNLGFQFVPGKDMNALSLTGATFQITQRRRNEECYNNLEKCVHGILYRGWFNMENLHENAGFMSSGFNGIDMVYRNGKLAITADTLSKRWQIDVNNVAERQWMFLEVSFHPKYGLSVYRDGKKVADAINYSSIPMQSPTIPSKFVVGGTNDARHVQASMIVDDLEIWYGDRDYICSLQLDTICGDGTRTKHYVIDFDEWDQYDTSKLSHEELIIPASGSLEKGLYINALDIDGSSGHSAEVTYIKPERLVRNACFGNLRLCSKGYTAIFYLKPETNSLGDSNDATYFLSTGTNGIDVYYKNGRLYAEARSNNWKWRVQSRPNYLVEDNWNKIIVAWSPVKGLVLATDERMYIEAQDMIGQKMPNQVDEKLSSRFLIGNSNYGVGVDNRRRLLRAAFDEMTIMYEYLPPRLGPIEHDSFSFERNSSLNRNKVEHPKFDIRLINGAELVGGQVGNTSSLNGNGQYVDLGDHSDSCIDNLDKCDRGTTLSFRLKRKGGTSQGSQVVLSGNSYDISIVDGSTLNVKLMTKEKEWEVKSFTIPSDVWHIVDVSWTADDGLELYVNDVLSVRDTEGRTRQQRVSTGNRLLVGKANNQANRRYFNGEVDEIHFYRARRQELVKKGIIPQPRCAILGLIVAMDAIRGNKVVHPHKADIMVHGNPVVTSGLIGKGIALEDYQHIDVGSRLSCQSRPNACISGFTMRVSIKPTILTRNSYLIASNPAEVVYGSDGKLHVRYRSVTGVWESVLSGLQNGVWYTIDLSWDDENGMTVYVNNVQRAWLQKTSSSIANYNSSNHFFVNKPSSPLVKAFTQSEFVVDNLQIWDAKQELLKACDLFPDAPEPVKHDAIYPTNGKGYIRLFYIPPEYAVTSVGDETLSMKFLANRGDGLLWYNMDDDIKSYVYLKNGDLWFGTQKGSGPSFQRRITVDQNLADGLDHTFVMRSQRGNRLVFNLDGTDVKTITGDYKVRFITEDFNIGGHKNPTGVTGSAITSSFVGTIKDLRLNGTAYDTEFDIFKEMWSKQFPDYVRVSCDMVFDPKVEFICDQGDASVTFLASNTHITEASWSNKGKKPSIDVRFTTVEPKGLLLFTGTQHDEFFALEVFDRILYMVTDTGNGPVRRQVSTGEVADNVPHTAKFVFNSDDNKIYVFFDGARRAVADVPLSTARNGMKTMFNGAVYLGGYSDYSRLPWHVWSEGGFIGCVEHLQINTLSSQLRALYKEQRAQHIRDGCLPFRDHCDVNPCKNNAPCTNRAGSYYCDCTGMVYADHQNDVCAKLTLIGNINGSTYYDINLGKDIKTHINDFSTRFKTMAEKGTMFMTYSPTSSEFIKAFFDDGVLKVAVFAGGQLVVTGLDGQFNDYEWHVLNVRRRADDMYIWVDDMQPTKVDIPKDDFYIYMNTIRLGADIPNPGPPPYFFGHLTNFRWPSGTDRIPPFSEGGEESTRFHEITFLTPWAYIKVPNTQTEMKSAFKVILMIKTEQEDSLFLYQPGRRGHYLAGLLKDGYLNVRFNFGDGDELIVVPGKYLSDNRWHIIEIYRKTVDKLSVKVDHSSPVTKTLSENAVQFDHGETMFIGGTPSSMLLAAGLRRYYSGDITGYRGCMASLVKSRKVVDLTNENLQDPEIRAANSIVSGCRDQPVCEVSMCKNGCTCSNGQTFCDNSMIPFHGRFCETPDVGFEFFVDGSPGQVTLTYDPIETTVADKISFGFITCHKNGLFTRIRGSNSNEEIKIYLQDSSVVAEYRLGGVGVGQLRISGPFNDEKLYIVQFVRQGLQADLTIIDSTTGRRIGSKSTVLSGSDNRLNGLRLLEIGSEKNGQNYENAFNGVIIGFKHGNYPVFNLAKGLTRWTDVLLPGTSLVSGDPVKAFKCTKSTEVFCGADKQICQNYGVCENNRCNCSLTAYRGLRCTEEPHGHYYGYNNWKPGIAIHEYPQAVTTLNDYFAIGLMTYEPNGAIFRVQNSGNSQYYDIRLVNGKARLEYRLKDRYEYIEEDRITLNSRDNVYHVIRMNRTGDTINFFVDDLQRTKKDPNIRNVQFRNQKKIMSGGMMRQPNKIEDDWNGILAGLYYNGKFMYHLSFDGSSYRKYGDVEIADHPFRLKFEPEPECQTCDNGGVMLKETKTCDCQYTGYAGLCCDSRKGLWGFYMKKYGTDTVVIYRNASIIGQQVDDLSVSFRSAKGWDDGEIVRVESKDKSQYIIVEIVKDLVRVRHNLSNVEVTEVFTTVNATDQTDHTIRIHRTGDKGYIKLDNIERETNFIGGGIFDANVIYVGGIYDGTRASYGHYGIIWGVNYNGIDIVDQANSRNINNGITVIDKDAGNFEIVPHPWPTLCEKGSLNAECNWPIPPTSIPGGAGAVIPEIPIVPLAPPVVPKPVVSGVPIETSIGAIIGAVMGGLLFSSAIAFAAAGMKPGFLALSKKFANAKGYVPVSDGKSSAFPVANGGNNYVVAVGMEEYGAGAGAGGSQADSRRSQYEDSFAQESRFDATDTSVAGAGAGGAMNGTMGAGGAGYNTYNSSSWFARNETLENQNQSGFGAGSTIGGYGAGKTGYAGSVAGGSVSGSVYGFGTVTNPDQAFITLSEDIAVDNVVLTADGRYVVTGSNLGPPQVWNTTNGEMVTTMRGDYLGSTGLHLAANEQYLIGETMAEQAAVDMNDIQTGNHIPIRRVAVWDFNTGNPLPIAVDQLCTASCVSKDGYKVVMAMTDKFGGGTSVKVLDLLTNKVLHEVTYPDTIGVADSASCVFISPDDRFVAVGFTNSFDNNANFIIFDLFDKSGVVDSPIVALNADPHCTVILNHDEALTGTKNGELVIWSMKTGKAQRQLTSGDATMLSHGGMPAAHDREVREVALSDDGKYLASASSDRTVKIWSMDTESLLHTLHGHNDEVWTVDIASDNSIVVSGSQDGTIKLWRLRNGNQITSFNATMDIFHARFSKDKKTVVALGDKYGARKLIMLQIVSQKKWRMRNS